MNIYLDDRLSNKYKSGSQKARVLTESWVQNEIFCPYCGSVLTKAVNNSRVLDFRCVKCCEEYELKSSKSAMHSKVVDGDCLVMLERIRSLNNPNFFFLKYDIEEKKVVNFIAVPKFLFVPEIIEKRKPLSSKAKRAGWVGCNILIKNIPNDGKISYVSECKPKSKRVILQNWQKVLFLNSNKNFKDKSWIMDVMRCIDSLNKKEFLLKEIYSFEEDLKNRHPQNYHIKDKIRQQLQILRDNNYLEYVDKGYYKLK